MTTNTIQLSYSGKCDINTGALFVGQSVTGAMTSPALTAAPYHLVIKQKNPSSNVMSNASAVASGPGIISDEAAKGLANLINAWFTAFDQETNGSSSVTDIRGIYVHITHAPTA
jgi:hypothetical protein